MQVYVIDGQGGGIGSTLIEELRRVFNNQIEIIALGTNALATQAMLKSGANQGATGENAIVINAAKAKVIMGSISILLSNSMLGELTPAMAIAIVESPAHKIVMMPNKYNIFVAGVAKKPLPHNITFAIQQLKIFLEESANV